MRFSFFSLLVLSLWLHPNTTAQEGSSIGSSVDRFETLYTDSSDFQVGLLREHPDDHPEKLRKTELGIRLPENLMQEVRSFVYNLRMAPGIKPLNPFLEWELDVQAQFHHPDGT